MVDIVAPLEDGSASQELGQDAADGPHVDAGGVVGKTQHDLRRSVPSSGHVFRHQAGLTRLSAPSRLEPSCQTEITDLYR